MKKWLPIVWAIPDFMFGHYLLKNKRLGIRWISNALYHQVSRNDYTKTELLERCVLPHDPIRLAESILPYIHDISALNDNI